MRFFVVLLATLFAGTSALSAAMEANVGLPVDFLRNNPRDAAPTRKLRSDRTEDSEQRAISFNAPTPSKFVEWLFSPKVAAAKKLNLAEKIRIEKWMYKQKNSEYVFNKLGLSGGLDGILTNPKLHLYAAYIDRFNKQHSTNKVSMLDMFTTTYGTDGVIKLLGMGTSDATTMKFTSRLRTELATSWVTSGKTADEIFTLLKLDRGAYKIFTTPPMNKEVTNSKLYLYARYLDIFNKEKPKEQVSMLDMLSKTYGEDDVAKMVELGLKNPKMEKVSSLLRGDLLGKWHNSEEPAENVFKILKLDEAGYDLFASPQLNTWYVHIKSSYDRAPEDVMLDVLVGHYGYDGLSKIFILGEQRIDLFKKLPMDLENIMVKRWLTESKSSNQVFELLKLNRGLDGLLINPNLRMWESYRMKLSSQTPEKVPPAISTVLTFYGVKDLSAMLEKAINVPATASIAAKWQHELANKIKR
ncbi:secreted RxLR effector peptide protein, putative [Phytophthora infestans T30-4]